ncbi:dihydroxyacetone kinase subunit DhaK, partial [Mesorhizobium sp. M7A.F.Ca.US.001.01.1.1]
MKKFINSVDTVLTESLDGFVAAHADILVLGDEHKFIRRKTLRRMNL